MGSPGRRDRAAAERAGKRKDEPGEVPDPDDHHLQGGVVDVVDPILTVGADDQRRSVCRCVTLMVSGRCLASNTASVKASA